MVPQLHGALRAAGCETPRPAANELSQSFKACSFFNMAMTAELARIAAAFAEAKIPLISLKGPLLAQQVYRHGEQRQYRDLDLLVPPEFLVASARLLETLGYGGQIDCLRNMSPAQLRCLKKFYKHVNGVRRRGSEPVVVELHWRLGETPGGFPVSDSRLWQHAEEVTVAGCRVNALPFPESLLFLSYHGGFHRWKRLSWLCDMVRAMECRQIDWEAVQESASRLAVRPYLEVALLLVDELIPDHAIPPAVLSEIAPSRGMRRVLASARHAMVADPMFYENQPLSAVALHFQIGHRFSDKLHSLQSIFAPNLDDLLACGWWRARMARWQRLCSRVWQSPSNPESRAA